MRILLLILFSLLSMTEYAYCNSSERIKPQWLKKMPKPSNSSFSYQIISGTANSVAKATESCMSDLYTSAGLSGGVVVTIDNDTKRSISQRYNNGVLSEVMDVDLVSKSSIKSNEVSLYVANIDQYWERMSDGSYVVTRLIAKSIGSTPPRFDNVESATSYGAQGLWRSLIVPGWGQFYKGSNLKGGLMLGGTALFAVAAVFADNQASDYNDKINHTYDVDHIRSYATKSDNYTSIRNICIGAAAAIYIYNIIDAIAAPGARRIKVNKRNKYVVAPSVMDNGAMGLSGGVKF